MKKAFKKFNKEDKNNFNFATLLGFDYCTFCTCNCDIAYKPASSYMQNAIEEAGY